MGFRSFHHRLKLDNLTFYHYYKRRGFQFHHASTQILTQTQTHTHHTSNTTHHNHTSTHTANKLPTNVLDLELIRTLTIFRRLFSNSSVLKGTVFTFSFRTACFKSDKQISRSYNNNNRRYNFNLIESVPLFSTYSSPSKMSAPRITDSDVGVREIKLPPTPTPTPTTRTRATTNTKELEETVNACSTCLLNGGVIAVPTDTIYGIAGLAQNIDAVNRIYEIKQRNYDNPVAISVGDVDDIYRWSKVTVPRKLLTELLPGPVTVVFERSPELNASLNPHTSKIGIRIPGNVFMQKLSKQCNSPIALTSANISGGRSCLQVEEFQHLWPQIDFVVNGGVLNDTQESRLGSTVVDLSAHGSFRIIRNGSAYVPTVKVLQDKYNLKNATTLPQAHG